MRTITAKIAAGGFDEFQAVGDYIRIKSASVAVRLEIDNGSTDATLEEGDALNLKPFTRIRVSHTDAAEQTIVLLIGLGETADGAKVGGSVTVNSMPAGAVAMTQTANAVGVASAQLVAANASRRLLMIQNNDAAADVFLNVAGAAAVLNQGVKLGPGDSITLDVWTPSAAVFAIASVATAAGAVVVVEG